MLLASWPNRVTAEDSGVVYEGADVPRIPPSVLLVEAAMRRRAHDPLAPALRHLASDVLRADATAGVDSGSAWLAMLYDDPAAPHRTYATAPLSYLAHGGEEVTARSSWRGDALYADFVGGPWVAFGGSGEELFAKGAVVVTNGHHALLVNVPAQLMRTIPGTRGTWDNDLYTEQFADSGQRGIYNILYAGSGPAAQPGDHARADGDHAAIVANRDAGAFVLARAAHLEQGFPRVATSRNLRRWTRTMLVLRPSLVLIYDQSRVVSGAAGQQRAAFHLGGLPRLVGVGTGTTRYDVAGAGGSGYVGSVDVVLPLGDHEATTNVFGSSKAWRLDVSPGVVVATTQTWLSVIDAAPRASRAASVALLCASGAEAVLLHRAGITSWRAVFARAGARRISLTRPGGGIRLLVTGLVAGGHYAVTVTPTAHGQRVTLRATREGQAVADTTGSILI